mmetsp:Transcript_3815/g.5995  ORF Transcript_3815/g.5995 Transcript_3815/m.5995 type:complete len:86 (+) Transcript_3815:242-499(+)
MVQANAKWTKCKTPQNWNTMNFTHVVLLDRQAQHDVSKYPLFTLKVMLLIHIQPIFSTIGMHGELAITEKNAQGSSRSLLRKSGE